MSEQQGQPTSGRPETEREAAELEPGRPGAEREDAGGQSPNREAANYRRRLRDTEAERDDLRERLDTSDRREIERLAAERLADPGDLWLATSLDEMRGEDGLLDPEKANAEIGRVLKEKPHWKRVELPEIHHGPRETVEEPQKPSFGQTVKKQLGGG